MTKEEMVKDLRNVATVYEMILKYSNVSYLTYTTWFERLDNHEDIRKAHRFIFTGRKAFLIYLQAARQLMDAYSSQINWELMMTINTTQKEVQLFKDTLKDVKTAWVTRPFNKKRTIGD